MPKAWFSLPSKQERQARFRHPGGALRGNPLVAAVSAPHRDGRAARPFRPSPDPSSSLTGQWVNRVKLLHAFARHSQNDL